MNEWTQRIPCNGSTDVRWHQVERIPLFVPRLRHGKFSTEMFALYQRSEQALILLFMEMVVSGVSTKMTGELCGGWKKSFDKFLIRKSNGFVKRDIFYDLHSAADSTSMKAPRKEMNEGVPCLPISHYVDICIYHIINHSVYALKPGIMRLFKKIFFHQVLAVRWQWIGPDYCWFNPHERASYGDGFCEDEHQNNFPHILI